MHRVIREYEAPGFFFDDPRRWQSMDIRMGGYHVPVCPAGDIAHVQSPGPGKGPERFPVLTLPAVIQEVSAAYHVPRKDILAVLSAVARKPSGIGPMGIPAAWLPVLRRAGFSVPLVERNDAWNIAAGAWILGVSERRAPEGPSGPVNLSARFRARLAEGAGANLTGIIDGAAARYRVPAPLIAAVILQESGGNPGAVSPKGAMGLMQLMPATAKRYGAPNPYNAQQSIFAGTAYLAHLLREFQGNVPLALAGYNAGGQAVRKWGGIPPYRQTQAYVPAVIHKYWEIAR